MSETEAHPTPRAARPQSGFTLIEVLVAFIVLALGTLVVQRAVMTAVTGTERADDRLRAEMVARTLMTAPLSAGSNGLTQSDGIMDGLKWTLRFEPLALPFSTAADAEGAAPGWVPLRMIVIVQLPARRGFSPGVNLRVDTVRLVRGPRA